MIGQRIFFDKLNNVRDLGGMLTTDGYRIKSGLLFRSDCPNQASEGDKQKLKKIGVKYILDLRNIGEYSERPDPEIPGIEIIHLPLNPERMAGISRDKQSLEEIRKKTFANVKSDPLVLFNEMKGYYASYAETPYTWEKMREFLTFLADSDGGVLWHCAGGKDRTGILAYLLLNILGVSTADIEEDYLFSNVCKAPEVEEAIEDYRKYMPEDFPEDLLRPMISHTWLSFIDYLDHFRDIVNRNYGDLNGFLTQAVRVTPDLKEALKNKYLEK